MGSVDRGINKRIKEIAEKVFSNNITAMAKATFISRTTIYGIIGEKEVTPGYDILRRIVEMETPKISIEWLMTGEGDMIVSRDSPELCSEEETRPRIPMSVAAGTLCGFAESVKAHDCELVPVVKAFPEYDYTIIVKGDSMEPKFEGGDEIAIRRVAGIIEWGKPYVLDTADGAVLKRLYDEGDKFRCVSFNKEYPDFEVLKSDVFGVYKVVGLIRIE